MVVLKHPGQIHAGYSLVINCRTSHISCRFDKLIAKYDRRSGQKLEANPEFIKVISKLLNWDMSLVNLAALYDKL